VHIVNLPSHLRSAAHVRAHLVQRRTGGCSTAGLWARAGLKPGTGRPYARAADLPRPSSWRDDIDGKHRAATQLPTIPIAVVALIGAGPIVSMLPMVIPSVSEGLLYHALYNNRSTDVLKERLEHRSRAC
jgi:hypothetical protein